eukprot:GDKK01042245.1.p1 GENE.GDKK01042245.1~~GDKK01042245.1.p1  ORF type:complete len:667 (+),score=106.37 GDKK01042245.1:102-2003(+)
MVETSKKLAQEKLLFEKKLIDHSIEVTKMNSIFFDLKARHDAMKIVYERENQTLRQLLSDHNIIVPDIDYQRLFEQQYSRLTGHRRRLQVDSARVVRDPYSVTCFAADGRSPVPLPRRARPPQTSDIDGWSLALVEPESLFSHEGVVTSSTFSRGAGILAVGFDECVRIYDVSSGERVLDLIQAAPGMNPEYQSIPHFAPLPCAGLRSLDLAERQNQKGAVRSIAFSRDDEYLFVGCESSFVTIYDLHTARPVLTLEGHTDPVFSVACTPKTNHLASAGADGRILIWKINSSGTPARDRAANRGQYSSGGGVFDGSDEANLDRNLDKDDDMNGTALKSSSWTNTTDAPGANIQSSSSSSVGLDYRLQLDGGHSCASSTRKRFQTVRPRLGLGIPPTVGLLSPIDGVINPNSAPPPTKEERAAAIAAADGVVSFKGWLKGGLSGTSNIPGSSLSRGVGELDDVRSISSVKWIGETHLTFAGHEGTVSISDTETGTVVRKWGSYSVGRHSSAVFGLTVSPDEQTIVSASLDGSIKVWDPRQASAVATMSGHKDFVLSVSVSPDGRFILSGSKDRSICIWSFGEWTRYCGIKGHNNSVLSVDCSNDGELFCSGGGDGKVRVWRYGYEGDETSTLDF